MAFLNDELRTQLKEIFSPMKKRVSIALFVKEEDCETCQDTKGFMEEMAELSDKLLLTVYDLNKDVQKATELDVTLSPAIVLLDENGKNLGVKFNGIPAGHEINSFITGVLEMGGAGSDLPPELVKRIKAIDKPVDVKVFVTLSCPHCPGAVAKAHKIAMLNPLVKAEMIEANTFGDLSRKFNVSGVPKIVFNNGPDLLGDQPLEAFLSAIEKLSA